MIETNMSNVRKLTTAEIEWLNNQSASSDWQWSKGYQVAVSCLQTATSHSCYIVNAGNDLVHANEAILRHNQNQSKIDVEFYVQVFIYYDQVFRTTQFWF